MLDAKECDGPTIRVMDIGAGSGLLGMLSAKAGADEVMLVEKVPQLLQVAVDCVNANDLDAEIFLVQAHSQSLSAEEVCVYPADLCVLCVCVCVCVCVYRQS